MAENNSPIAILNKMAGIDSAVKSKQSSLNNTVTEKVTNIVIDPFEESTSKNIALLEEEARLANLEAFQYSPDFKSDPRSILTDDQASSGAGFAVNTLGGFVDAGANVAGSILGLPKQIGELTPDNLPNPANSIFPGLSKARELIDTSAKEIQNFTNELDKAGNLVSGLTDPLYNKVNVNAVSAELGQAFDSAEGTMDAALSLANIAIDNPAVAAETFITSIPQMMALGASGKTFALNYAALVGEGMEGARTKFIQKNGREPAPQEESVMLGAQLLAVGIDAGASRFIMGKPLTDALSKNPISATLARTMERIKGSKVGKVADAVPFGKTVAKGVAAAPVEAFQEASQTALDTLSVEQDLTALTDEKVRRELFVAGGMGFGAGGLGGGGVQAITDTKSVLKSGARGAGKVATKVVDGVNKNKDEVITNAQERGDPEAVIKTIEGINFKDLEPEDRKAKIRAYSQAVNEMQVLAEDLPEGDARTAKLAAVEQNNARVVEMVKAFKADQDTKAKVDVSKDVAAIVNTTSEEALKPEEIKAKISTTLGSMDLGEGLTEEEGKQLLNSKAFNDNASATEITQVKEHIRYKAANSTEGVSKLVREGGDGFKGTSEYVDEAAGNLLVGNTAGVDKTLTDVAKFGKFMAGKVTALKELLNSPDKSEIEYAGQAYYNADPMQLENFIRIVEKDVDAIRATYTKIKGMQTAPSEVVQPTPNSNIDPTSAPIVEPVITPTPATTSNQVTSKVLETLRKVRESGLEVLTQEELDKLDTGIEYYSTNTVGGEINKLRDLVRDYKARIKTAKQVEVDDGLKLEKENAKSTAENIRYEIESGTTNYALSVAQIAEIKELTDFLESDVKHTEKVTAGIQEQVDTILMDATIKLPTNSEVDPRLSAPEYRATLDVIFDRDSEENSGGKVVPDPNFVRGESDSGNVPMIRLPSRNPEWVKDILQETGMTVAKVNAAIVKALNGGKKLGVQQAYAVQMVLDYIEFNNDNEANSNASSEPTQKINETPTVQANPVVEATPEATPSADESVGNLGENLLQDNGLKDNKDNSATDLFKPVNKDKQPTGLLNKIHNLISNLKSDTVKEQLPEMNDTEAKAFGKIVKFISNFTKAMDNKNQASWLQVLTKSEFYLAKDNSIEESPFGYLVQKDENGNRYLNENLMTTIGLMAYNWAATEGRNTVFNTQGDINSLLGRNSDHPVSATEFEQFAMAGSVQNQVALNIGGKIYAQLGIEGKVGINGHLENRLKLDLGTIAIAALLSNNVITQTKVAASAFTGTGANVDAKPTNFIKVNTVETTELSVPSPRLDSMQTNVQDAKTIIEAIMELPVYRIEPLSSPSTNTPKYMQGTNQEVPSETKETVKFNQEVPYTQKPVSNLVRFLGKTQIAKMLGFNDDIENTVHVTKWRAVKGKNLSIMRSIDNAWEFLQSNPENLDFFIEYAVLKQTRIRDKSNTISLQNDKFHRHIFGAKRWKITIPAKSIKSDEALDTNVRTQFKYAVAQAFGVKVDDQPGQASLDNFDEIYNTLVVQEAIEGIRKLNSDVGLSPEEEQSITEAITAATSMGSNELAILDALTALADYNPTESFTTFLANEADAKTSGMVIGTAQSMIEGDSLDKLSGGNWFTDGVTKDGGVAKVENGNTDNYEKLTNAWITALQQFIGFEQVQNIAMMLGSMSAVEDKIYGLARDLSKNPLMITTYGASVKRVVNEFADGTLQTFYDKLTEVRNDPAQLALLETQISNILLKEITLPNGVEALKFKLERNDAKTLVNLTKESYGVALEEAINSQFEQFADYRNIINVALNTMFKVFNIQFEGEVKAKEAIKGEPLSNEERVQIANELQDLMPIFKGPLSKGISDGLLVMNSDLVTDYSEETRSQVVFNAPIPNTSKSLKDKGNSKSITGHSKVRQYSDGGVAGLIAGIQAIDSTLIQKVMDQLDILNIYDAQYTALDQLDQGVDIYNQAMYEVNRDYNIIEAVQENFLNVMAKVNDNPDLKDALDLALVTEAMDKAKKFNNDFEGYDTQANIENELAAMVERVNEARKPLYDGTLESNVSHMSFPGMSYQVPVTEAENLNALEGNLDNIIDKAIDELTVIAELEAFEDAQITKAKAKEKITPVEAPTESGDTSIPSGTVVEFTAVEDGKEVRREGVITTLDIGGTETVVVFSNNTENKGSAIYAYNSGRVLGRYKKAIVTPKTKVINKLGKGVITEIKSLNETAGEKVQKAVNEATRNTDAKTKIVKPTKSLGSSGKLLDPTKFGPNPNYVLTADNTIDIFDALKSLGQVLDPKGQTDYLKNLLKTTISRGLQKLADIEIKLKQEDNINAGMIKDSTIYINTALGTIGTNVAMSAQEVFTHETVHAILRDATDNNFKFRKALQNLFDIAKDAVDVNGDKIFTPDMFLTKDANGNIVYKVSEAAEKKAAQDQYDYIFNNTVQTGSRIAPKTGNIVAVYSSNYLHEFGAFGLTNKPFRDALAKINSAKTRSITKGTLLERLEAFYYKMLDLIGNTYVNTRGKNGRDALLQLTNDLVGITGKNRNNINLYLSKLQGFNEETIAALNKFIFKPLREYTANAKKAKTRPGKVLNSIAVLPEILGENSTAFRKILKQVLRNIGLTEQTMIIKLVREGLATKAQDIAWHTLLRFSKHTVDQARRKVAEEVAIHIQDSYLTEVSKEEAESLTRSLIKTDLVTLLDSYNVEELVNLLRNPTALRKEIEKATQDLTQYGENGNYYIKQSRGLGNFMAQGVTKIHGQKFNAYMIAGLFETERKVNGNVNEIEVKVDVLASLYALSFTNKTNKDNAANVITKEYEANSEENGIITLLDLHREFKARSLQQLFSGNKMQTTKGFTSEIYNPNIEIRVALGDAVTEREMKDIGFKKLDAINKDQRKDPNKDGETQFMYVSDTLVDNSYLKSIMSLRDQSARGTTLADAYRNEGATDSTLQAIMDKSAVREREKRLVERQFQDPDITKYEGSTDILSPIFNDVGETTGYRYLMSESVKQRVLQKDDRQDVVMGRMFGSIKDKIATKEVNRRMIQLAKDDFVDGFNDDPGAYVKIGKNSANPRYAEIYRMMPEQAKQDVRNVWGKDYMMVRAELVDLAFGYRRGTFTDMGGVATLFKAFNPNGQFKHIAKSMESLWMSVVSIAKDNIVVKSGIVLLENFESNNMYLLVRGVKPTDIIKDQTTALIALNEYMGKERELNTLQLKLDITQGMSKAKKDNINRGIAKLQSDLDANPIKDLIDEGIFQSITEDIDLNENIYGNKERLIQKVQPIIDKIPSPIVSGYKYAYLSHDTAPYKMLVKGTQYSDFIARYTLYKHLRTGGMSKDAALADIVESFVNYDIPTGQIMQYMNDIGLLMFTKFLFRIQRVLFKMFKEKPATSLAVYSLQQAFGDVADIPDSNIFSFGLSKFNDPTDVIDSASYIAMLNWIGVTD